ncbi:MAG: DNA-binding response regulator [Chloroflexi bacterium HGW-Chloroflexi-10]|nr:MAG: DNA-binding response regulator [Chloroflexi bacterium HGW-Chloroflexi-10]
MSVTTTKILLIDDEPSIHNVVTAYLKAEGYEFQSAMDGPAGLRAARSFKPDIIVLDVMLPGMDGIELLANLRRESNVYVIMLTARSEETDKIVGLSVGADDYLTKPFSPRELIARIKAALRRMQSQNTSIGETALLNFAHLRIDLSARRVWVDDHLIELTAVEFDLLVALAQHHSMVLSREQLLEKAWGYDYFGDTRVVDVHIGHVRQKLGDDRFIETIRGVGYRFEDK